MACQLPSHPGQKSIADDACASTVEIAIVKVAGVKLTTDAVFYVLDTKHPILTKSCQVPCAVDQHVVLTDLTGVHLAIEAQELAPALRCHDASLEDFRLSVKS